MGNIPAVILSHRRQEFVYRTALELRRRTSGLGDIVVVDDSGDTAHHEWLDRMGFQFSTVHPTENRGYLEAMTRVFDVAGELADAAGTEYALLWEEDFSLQVDLRLSHMVKVMEGNPRLAHLNLQRQAVYRVEKQFGYLESHERRGYGLSLHQTNGVEWIKRDRPFTTNPGLIRRELLDMPWPSRMKADKVVGGAEPAMSLDLEAAGWHFGWLGMWNRNQTVHVSNAHKTGTGY